MSKYDIILSGVGGQGVLSVAAIITMGAMKEGLLVRQSEVHGMAQRGGAVLAHMRISDKEIPSDLIAKGSADVILSMEPLESLRYTEYLSPKGSIITSKEPLINIPDYPEQDLIQNEIKSFPSNKLINTKELAKEAGSLRAVNMVMVGAASSVIPIKAENLEAAIAEKFESKGSNIVEMNLKAFRLGREASLGK